MKTIRPSVYFILNSLSTYQVQNLLIRFAVICFFVTTSTYLILCELLMLARCPWIRGNVTIRNEAFAGKLMMCAACHLFVMLSSSQSVRLVYDFVSIIYIIYIQYLLQIGLVFPKESFVDTKHWTQAQSLHVTAGGTL